MAVCSQGSRHNQAQGFVSSYSWLRVKRGLNNQCLKIGLSNHNYMGSHESLGGIMNQTSVLNLFKKKKILWQRQFLNIFEEYRKVKRQVFIHS